MKYSTIKNLLNSLYAFADDCPTANVYWDQILHLLESIQDFQDKETDEFEIKRFQQACVAKYMLEEIGIPEEDMMHLELIEAYKGRMLD